MTIAFLKSKINLYVKIKMLVSMVTSRMLALSIFQIQLYTVYFMCAYVCFDSFTNYGKCIGRVARRFYK